MNERIQALAEQAGVEFIYDSTETPMRVFVEAWGEDLEKFAELIVRECVDVGIKDFYNHLPNIFPANAIKKHFGVEE
jgi:hypothetical protein